MTPAVDAAALMAAFAERTGVDSNRLPRRYLWTDAFAVCNFLALGQTELALKLVDQVHHVLGRQRHGGAPIKGLRIGKPMEERGPSEPVDDRLEWERDGQYFHYLTKWMHALDRVATHTGRGEFRDRALELASTAARAFVYEEGGRRRMYWKMSVDLTRPLVATMGQHDPVDGYVTCMQIGATQEAGIFASMIDTRTLATTDPLGLGGLLSDAWRIRPADKDLAGRLLEAARRGLSYYLELPDLHAPAGDRLAFRELGLAIGLAAPLDELREYQPVRAEIQAFWSDPAHQQQDTWTDHRDINEVMLATALVPGSLIGFGT